MSATLDPVDLALQLFAVDPAGLGGLRIRSAPWHGRAARIDWLKRVLSPDGPVERIPAGATAADLLGGLDLTLTLAEGKPAFRPGLLERGHGGLVVVPMGDALEMDVAGLLAQALSDQALRVEREGRSMRAATRFGLLLLDEGGAEGATPPDLLLDRIPLHVSGEPTGPANGWPDAPLPLPERHAILQARDRLPQVDLPEELLRELILVSDALGITSMRPALHGARVARVHAALAGRRSVERDDVEVALSLSLLPRARRLPASEETPPAELPPEPPAASAAPSPSGDTAQGGEAGDGDAAVGRDGAGVLQDRVVDAVRPLVVDGLDMGPAEGSGGAVRVGRRGREIRDVRRGRVVGVRAGLPRSGARLDALATLKAAAPFQRLRTGEGEADRVGVMAFQASDLRIQLRSRRAATATVFVVDASGSQALHRMAEAKGAVELILAESYVRRESVALVTFRGREARLELAPTRSPARARRILAGLPAGGGTPLAAGLDVGLRTALRIRSAEADPVLVLVTDGKPNVDRAGRGGRESARNDALSMARAVAAEGIPVLVVDSSPRPVAFAAELAAALRGKYLHLPVMDAHRLRNAIRTVSPD